MAGVKSGRAKRKLLGADMLQSSNANDGFWNAVVSQAPQQSHILRADILLLLQEQKAHMRDMWILLKKYDVDRSGSLDEQELANLIAHHAIESGTGATTSQSPNEAEIVWILETAGNYKHNLIHVQEIELVLQLWSSYVRNRDRIEYFFRKYGTSQSPKLDFNQMKMYLTELNGFPPKVIPRDPFPSAHTICVITPEASCCVHDYDLLRRAGFPAPRHHASRQRRQRHQPHAVHPGHVPLAKPRAGLDGRRRLLHRLLIGPARLGAGPTRLGAVPARAVPARAGPERCIATVTALPPPPPVPPSPSPLSSRLSPQPETARTGGGCRVMYI